MNELHFRPTGAVVGEGAAIRLDCHTPETPSGETHLYFEPCDSVKEVHVTQELSEDGGRVLDVTMTLQNVCPGRRVAVGMSLHEVREDGAEEARGFRALTLPAHRNAAACAVDAPAVRFILPEDVSLGGTGRSRHFVLRAYAHYTDQAQG